MRDERFRFHPEARAEFRGAVVWYRDQGARPAVAFRIAVADVIRRIVETPRRWPVYMYGTRRLVLDRFPFSVVYLEHPEELIIVAVAHSKRRPGYWRQRL
jgi:plasmid stabilization system protein ParE